jgi:hypothetical protein
MSARKVAASWSAVFWQSMRGLARERLHTAELEAPCPDACHTWPEAALGIVS